MPEGVIYADLRFARSPPEKGHQEEPGEGELTYENVQGAQAQEEKGVCGSLKNAQVLPLWATARHCWSPVANRQTLGALAVFLFLLATNIGVGIRYLQASQQLQQASRDHTAKHHVLGEELYALQVGREESQQLLHRAQGELNSTVAALGESAAALGECWVAANRTHQQLRRQEQSLSQANLSLAVLQVERRSLEANLSQATSCRQIGPPATLSSRVLPPRMDALPLEVPVGVDPKEVVAGERRALQVVVLAAARPEALVGGRAVRGRGRSVRQGEGSRVQSGPRGSAPSLHDRELERLSGGARPSPSLSPGGARGRGRKAADPPLALCRLCLLSVWRFSAPASSPEGRGACPCHEIQLH
ncbi:B-cell differentiation antigen CD72 [Candoia aspera]|uniref:B-cell differentiation antigen CD72 n=1 Tax=Candoia aspera TaxID=51853 RepID=UPI002FD82C92